MADFLNEKIDAVRELQKELAAYKKSLIEVVKVEKKSAQQVDPSKAKAKDIKKLDDATQNLIKTEEKLVKVSAEEIKVEKELNKINSEANKLRVEGNIIKEQARKRVKALAKENLGLLNAYQKESKRLNDLRKKYKNLAVQQKENTVKGRLMLANIKRLDANLKKIDKTVGQTQRSVGDYSSSIKDAVKESGLFSKQLGVLKQIQATVNAITQKSTTTTEINTIAKGANANVTAKLTRFQKLQALASGGAAKAMKVLNVVMKASPLLLIAGSLGSLFSMFTRTKEGADSMASSMAGLGAATNVVIDRFSDFGGGLVTFFKGDYSKGIDQMGASVSGVTEEIKEEYKAMKDLTDASHELRDLEMSWITVKANLRKEIAMGRLEAKDENRTNQERLNLLIKAGKKEEELLDFQLEGQAEKVRIMEEQLELAHSLPEAELALEEARGELIDLETASLKRRATIASAEIAFRRKIKAEKEKDAADARKAFNKDVADEIAMLKEKQKAELALVKGNDLLTLDLKDEHLNEIFNLEKKFLDVSANDKKLREERLNNAILKNDLDRIKKQDELEKLAADKRAKKMEEEIEASNALTQFRLDNARDTAEGIDAIEDKSIEAARFRFGVLMQDLEEGSDERILLEKKLEAEITSIHKTAQDERDQITQESLEEHIRFAQSLTNELGTELDTRLNNQKESLNKESDDIQKAIDLQAERSRNGLENTLAFEEARLAKNQVAKIANEKRAASLKEAIRLGELFLTLKEAEAQEQVQGSTSRALVGVAEAKAITQGIKTSLDIAGFEKGGLVEGDEQIIRINEKGEEFVVDAATTSALGLDKKGSNMQDFNNMFSMHEMNKSDRVVQSKDGSYKVIEAVKSLEQTLKDKPVSSVDINALGQLVEEVKKAGMNTITTYKTSRRI